MSDDMSDETTPIVCACGCDEFDWNDDEDGLQFCAECGAPLVVNGKHLSIYDEE